MDPRSQPVSLNVTGTCFILNITSVNGIWHGENPFQESLPFFITQLSFVLVLNYIFFYILKPFRQPRIVANLLSGIMLGPSVLGETGLFPYLFPTKDIVIVETLAYMGLIFHVFLIGLELDVTSVLNSTKKAVTFSVSGIFVPFLTGVGLFYLLQAFKGIGHNEEDQKVSAKGAVLWATALTVTSFPVVTEIMSNLKLTHTDIGRLGMSTALIKGLANWLFIIFLLPFCGGSRNGAYVLTSTLAFILFSIYVLRPMLDRVINGTNSKHTRQFYSDYALSLVLIGALLSAFVADVTGTHSVVGAFVFGLVMPSSDLGVMLIERFDYFISTLLMPMFFTVCGIRVNIYKIHVQLWLLVIFIILLCFIKIFTSLFFAFSMDVSARDGMAFGVLMSAKGVLALVVINSAWDGGVLHDDDYAVMVLAILVMTAIVSPTLSIIYKRSSRPIRYKRRSLQGTKANSELRLLICISSLRNVPGIIQLLDFSRTSKQTVQVFALHLVEQSGGASATLIVHSQKSSASAVAHLEDNPESEHIFRLLGDYEDENPSVSINPLTSLSPYDTMHEDICSLTEDKRVAFLIIPYHKQVTEGGHMEETNHALCSVNQCVLLEAPCSVGILVDRSLGVAKEWRMYRVAVIFLGGPDDREALTFARRMIENSEVCLTVFRFLLGGADVLVEEPLDVPKHVPLLLPSRSYIHRQIQMDDEFLYEFRLRTASEESVDYQEKLVHNGEELRTALEDMRQKNELCIVGRGSGLGSPLTAGLDKEFRDSPELGIVGGLLTSTDPSTSSSVLVVQQYVGPSGGGSVVGSVSYSKTTAGTASMRSRDSEFGMWRHNSIGNYNLYDNDVEAFMKHKRKYESYDDDDDEDESTY